VGGYFHELSFSLITLLFHWPSLHLVVYLLQLFHLPPHAPLLSVAVLFTVPSEVQLP
jgi:hypothetical protein